MRFFVRRWIVMSAAIFAAAALFACASNTGPRMLDQRLTGTWSENGLGQFGTSFIMVLAARDTNSRCNLRKACAVNNSGSFTASNRACAAESETRAASSLPANASSDARYP